VLHKRVLNPIFRNGSYGVYETQSEAYQLTTKIIDEFYRDVLVDGALPVIVVFPGVTGQVRSRQGKPRAYQRLLDQFNANGYPVIDALRALVPVESDYSLEELSAELEHYSALANNLVAEFIYDELLSRGLLGRQRVEEAIRSEQMRLEIVPQAAEVSNRPGLH
jgi:hypothetical protein